MRKIAKPTDDPTTVFLTCISRVRDADLKARLTAVEPAVRAAAAAYEGAATTSVLHTLVPQVTDGVTQHEMSEVYEYRMVDRRSPGRPFYDAILALPPHGRCPLCRQRVVSTLDHHLPKLHHPALVVVPSNLVPCCGDCNHSKLAAVPGSEGEQTLHPYFDDFDDAVWLSAAVIETEPPAVRFFVEPPVTWTQLRAERVRHHFRLFELAPLYGSHAGEELVNIRFHLRRLSQAAGADGVRDHLAEMAESYTMANPNSWQQATYTALAESGWYCSGGFDWTD